MGRSFQNVGRDLNQVIEAKVLFGNHIVEHLFLMRCELLSSFALGFSLCVIGLLILPLIGGLAHL